MSDLTPPPEPIAGYRSAESKRRFTIVTGVLGAIFFALQLVLPMIVIFAFFLPAMARQASRSSDFRHAVLWQGELWYGESAFTPTWGEGGGRQVSSWLCRASPADLRESGSAISLGESQGESSPMGPSWELLPQGDRLWVIGADSIWTYSAGRATQLGLAPRPANASRPFLYRGTPSMITYGRRPSLVTLVTEGAALEWRYQPLELGMPIGAEWFRRLEAVPVGQRLHLIAEACAEAPAGRGWVCSMSHRDFNDTEWIDLKEEADASATWGVVAIDDAPAVVLAQGMPPGRKRFVILKPTATGSDVTTLPALPGLVGWSGDVLLESPSILLLSELTPGSRSLVEIDGAKVVRSVGTSGSSPFGKSFFALMAIPQVVPIVLSLLLALILSAQMHRHRIETYSVHDVDRHFASLWQRAWAQVVDALILGAVPLIVVVRWVTTFSDPEVMIDAGPRVFLLILGLMAVAFGWAVLVLVAFSYFEGRFGKTPGKALLRIRVLGTDLAPCGFWRALVRNLLTFVDGFFNFLVGVLLVALTDNWQRLGDLAARTIVVTDEPSRPQTHPL